jgi:hypothetical protein
MKAAGSKTAAATSSRQASNLRHIGAALPPPLFLLILHSLSATADGLFLSSTSVIPTGVAGFFFRAVVWRAGRGVEGPWQPLSSLILQSHLLPTQSASTFDNWGSVRSLSKIVPVAHA